MRLTWGARRRPGIPSEQAEALGLAGERVLAWSPLTGGGVAAATAAGLRVLTPFGRVISRPWTDVDHVAWDEVSFTLAVWWVGSRTPLPLEVGEGSFLPEVVHERVRASVVLTRDVPLPGHKPAWVALRKGADGTLSTQVVTPPGVRPGDPDVAAVLAGARLRLREDAGLSGPDDAPPMIFAPLSGDQRPDEFTDETTDETVDEVTGQLTDDDGPPR